MPKLSLFIKSNKTSKAGAANLARAVLSFKAQLRAQQFVKILIGIEVAHIQAVLMHMNVTGI